MTLILVWYLYQLHCSISYDELYQSVLRTDIGYSVEDEAEELKGLALVTLPDSEAMQLH